MRVKRLNADFGNSTNNFMVDGYYFELATNVVEISEAKSNKIFVSTISEPKDLLERLMISTVINGIERYFLVGEIAEISKLSNNHVTEMHDKIKSHIPLLSSFKPEGSEVVKFIYFGGESPILQEHIKKSLLNHMNEQFAKSNHLFLNDIIIDDKKEVFKPTSRTINLTALEILSINETKNLI